MFERYIRKVVSILLGISLLAGCSVSKSVSSKEDDIAKDDEDLTATLRVYIPSEEKDWVEKTLDEFNKAHPKWNLTFETEIVESSDIVNHINSNAEQTPDVFLFDHSDLPSLIENQMIAEIGGTTLENIIENNDASVVNTVSYDASVYGVPYSADTSVLYYDNRVFDTKDVKSLEAMLEKGKVGFALSDPTVLQAFYTANGCTIYGEDGSFVNRKFDFSGEKANVVTSYLVQLVSNKNYVNCTDEETAVSRFHDGTVNAIIGSTDSYASVTKAIGEDNIGYATLPSAEIGGNSVHLKALVSSEDAGVYIGSKNVKVAVALASYFASADSQQMHFDLEQGVPVTKNMEVEDGILKRVHTTLKKYSVNAPFSPDKEKFDAALSKLGNELGSKAITRDNSADRTATLNTEMNAN